MTKERLWESHSRRSKKKSDMSDLLMIQANRSQKRAIRSKKFLFLCFWQFFIAFPLFMPKSKSILSLLTKERLCGIRSCGLWQKSDRSDFLFFTSVLLFSSKKTRDSLEKPLSDFPTLHKVFILPSYFELMAPFLFLCFSLYSLCLSRSVDVEQVYPFHRWEIEYEHDTHQLWSHSYLHEYSISDPVIYCSPPPHVNQRY